MSHLDYRTNQCENEVEKIVHLQQIVSQLCDAFIKASKVNKLYILVINTVTRVIIHIEQSSGSCMSEAWQFKRYCSLVDENKRSRFCYK